MLSSILGSGCDENPFDYFLFYGYSRTKKGDETESVGLNLTYKPPGATWLKANISVSHVWKTWEDNQSGFDLIYQNRGIAYASISGTVDFTELLDPGTDLLDLRPHFLLTVGTTIPIGSENETYVQGQYSIPASYQMGFGEAVPFVSLSYYQNLGNSDFAAIALITESGRTKENEVGYQNPSSLSWLAGIQYQLAGTWSTAIFTAIGGTHTFSPARERVTWDDPVLGRISVPVNVPNSKADRITGNIGLTVKPFDERQWGLGLSLVFPLSTNVRDESNEMKWAASFGICCSF